MKLGTDSFAALRRLWQRQAAAGDEVADPVPRTTLQWDTAAGTCALSRVVLGLPGRRARLVHEQRETGDAYGSVGVRVKKAW